MNLCIPSEMFGLGCPSGVRHGDEITSPAVTCSRVSFRSTREIRAPKFPRAGEKCPVASERCAPTGCAVVAEGSDRQFCEVAVWRSGGLAVCRPGGLGQNATAPSGILAFWHPGILGQRISCAKWSCGPLTQMPNARKCPSGYLGFWVSGSRSRCNNRARGLAFAVRNGMSQPSPRRKRCATIRAPTIRS